MFSGIRSMLFGYSEAPATCENEEKSNSPTEELSKSEKSSLGNDTSALLEQTLNAATTKLTEQLLPHSQSIEQLQSSSRQLLPTLVEQHEEDESRKRKQVEGLESKSDSQANDDETDDDECFNADSWELLDLVDKPEVATSLNSAVQNDSVGSNCKQTSGILKPSGIKPSSSIDQDDLAKQTQRQKPKVSFETPDLVTDTQEKIEPIVLEDNDNKVKSKNSGNNKRKKNKQVKEISVTKGLSKEKNVPPKIINAVGVEKAQKKDVLATTIKPQEQPITSSIKKAPVLNYAAALAMKLNKDEGNNKKPTEVKIGVEVESKSVVTELEKPKPVLDLKPCGAVKRNRPVSSSSWSSSDEIEPVDSIWNDSPNGSKHNDVHEVDPVFDVDDNESIISSGFSDCDYGYHCINDYVMRPKKSQSKRRNGPSVSSSLLSSMSKRGTDRVAGQEQLLNVKKQPIMESSSYHKVTTSKNVKPKKKKMVMSPSTDSAEFLKKLSPEVQVNYDAQSDGVSQGVGNDGAATSSSLVAIQNSMMQSTQLMPPPRQATSSSNSGNDSSDIADMDESWFVTPPPCFTGSNKLNKTKAKEAARENALIEHPSVYIASTSKQVHPIQSIAIPANGNKVSAAADSLSKQKAIVLKKVSKQTVVTSNLDLNSKLKKSTSPSPTLSQMAGKKASEAWGNKFIVTNWNYDDQDDINDFDNLFEDEDPAPRPAKKTKAKRQQQNQPKSKEDKPSNIIPDGSISPSLAYESDFSTSSPALVGVTDTSSCLSLEMVADKVDDVELSLPERENISPDIVDEVKEEKVERERKAPVPVRPIEPERQPGWQLRRKRRKRRPLGNAVQSSSNSVSGQAKQTAKIAAMVGDFSPTEGLSSGQSSARSTPTLIDRIGSSIVANLTNLASGFPAANAMPIQARATIEEAVGQSAVRKSNSEFNLVSRRRMSKGYMSRQNDCAKLGNSLRRADRRLKMHTTPNGVSVNRKVQTNFR